MKIVKGNTFGGRTLRVTGLGDWDWGVDLYTYPRATARILGVTLGWPTIWINVGHTEIALGRLRRLDEGDLR